MGEYWAKLTDSPRQTHDFIHITHAQVVCQRASSAWAFHLWDKTELEKSVRLPIEARQRRNSERVRESKRERERRGEGVGVGEGEKREGERVMIKLHCEPSWKLSQSKRATETRGTGRAAEQGENPPHNKSLLSDVKSCTWPWTWLVGRLSREHLSCVRQRLRSSPLPVTSYALLSQRGASLHSEEKETAAGQRSKLERFPSPLGLHPCESLVCEQTDWLIWTLKSIFWWEPNFCGSCSFSSHLTTFLESGSTAQCENQEGERRGEKENIAIHIKPPQPTLSLGRPSSLPLLLPPVPPHHPTLHYTSPPNRAESVKNLTNGFICCQIWADLSFPWTILLDTFHSWVSLLAFWLEWTVPLQRCAGWELIKRGATAAAVSLTVSWTGSPWSCIPLVSFSPLGLLCLWAFCGLFLHTRFRLFQQQGTPVLIEKQCEDVVWGWASGRGGCSVLDSVCPSGWGGCQEGEEEAKGGHPTTYRDLQCYSLQQWRGRWKHQGSDRNSLNVKIKCLSLSYMWYLAFM